MTARRSWAAGEYLRFLVRAVAASTAIAVVGFLPTRRLGGEGALLGMVAGCGIGLLASALAVLPIGWTRGGSAADRYRGLLAAMGLRFGLTLVLALAAALSGRFDRVSLLLWVAIGYGALLVVDTQYALQVLGPERDPETS